MSKQLAIKIKFSSTGEEQVINNINELESAVDQLNKELKDLDFGSEEYKRTSQELNRLRSVLKDVTKETEGLDVEQKLSAFGGALDAISGSFLIASSAARTFGASAKSVEEIEELERQALEAVNIALGIRQISEGLVQANLLRRVIAEKAANIQTQIATGLQAAYTAAVGASTGALRLFRLALIGTGIGAVIVLIGELIANWDKLSAAIFGSSKELSDFEKIQKQARQETIKQTSSLDFYAGVVLDVNKSERERKIALEELNKLGVVSEDINLNNAESLEILANRIQLVRDNIILKAQAEAASQLLTESLKEQIEVQNSTLEENLGFWDKVAGAIATVYRGAAVGNAVRTTRALENQQEALTGLNDKIQRYEEIFIGFQNQLLQNEAALAAERENSTKSINRKNAAIQASSDAVKRAAERTNQYTESIKNLTNAIGNLNTEASASALILEKTQKVIDQQNELLNKRSEFFKDETASLIKEFENLIGVTLIPEDVEKATKDQFFEIFRTFTELTETARVGLSEIPTEIGKVGDSTIQVLKTIDENTGVETIQLILTTFDEINNSVTSSTVLLDSFASLNKELLDIILSQGDAEKLKAEVGEDVFQSLVDIVDANFRLNNQIETYNEGLSRADRLLVQQLGSEERLENIRNSINNLRAQGLQTGRLEFEIEEDINTALSIELFKIADINKLNEQQLALLKLANATLKSRSLNQIDLNKLTQDYIKIQDELVSQNKSTQQIEVERLSFLSKQLFGIKDISSLTEDQRKLLDEINKELLVSVQYYEDVLKVNSEFEKLSRQILDNLTKQGEQITDEQFEKLLEFVANLSNEFQTLEDIEPFQNLLDELQQLDKLRPNFEAFKEELSSIQDTDELRNFINELSTSSNLILGLTNQQLSTLKELAKGNVDELRKFIATISFDLTNLTAEQIEQLQKLIDDISFKKPIEKFQELAEKVIGELQNIAGQIQGILSAKISLQLDELSQYEEQVLATIGDQTERQRQIQEEFRQEVAKERFELEKKARIQELRFSLGSAIANGAQAVVKALTLSPPASFILAGVYGGITAAQVAVIQQQIDSVQSTQFVGRRGGLIMGNSHENGGVMMNNGGIVLEGGEAVINKNAVSQFSDLLSQMNVSTGGRPLTVDDSAIVQEIRKQNQRPVKTYVLYEDIKNTNKINSRLEQLSRL